jgi:hypothetical protein
MHPRTPIVVKIMADDDEIETAAWRPPTGPTQTIQQSTCIIGCRIIYSKRMSERQATATRISLIGTTSCMWAYFHIFLCSTWRPPMEPIVNMTTINHYIRSL